MADVNSEATNGGCEMCEVRDAGEKKENGVTATAHSFWIFGLGPQPRHVRSGVDPDRVRLRVTNTIQNTTTREVASNTRNSGENRGTCYIRCVGETTNKK